MSTNIKLQIPEGYEVDKDNSTWDNIVLKEKDNWVEKWEDLKSIEGWYVEDTSILDKTTNDVACAENKNVFKTKEQAAACVALAQLSQLMYVANDGWEPDWKDNQYKYIIRQHRGTSEIASAINFSRFLAFKNIGVGDRFAETHKDLILQALPLL